MKGVEVVLLSSLLMLSTRIAANPLPDRLYDLLRAMDDDPRGLSIAAKQTLAATSTHEHKGWLVYARYQYHDADETWAGAESELISAMAWADANKSPGLKALLSQMKASLNSTATTDSTRLNFENALQMASLDTDVWGSIRLTLDLCSFLSSQNKIGPALTQIEAAKKLRDVLPVEEKAYATALIDNEYAVILEAQNRVDEALDIHKKVHEFCQKDRLREFCAKNAFNMGAVLSNRTDIMQAEQAIPYFQTTVELAREIGFAHRIGVGTLGLANIAIKKKEFKTAEKYIRESIPLFEKSLSAVWLGDSWLKLAFCQMQLERYAEAEKSLDRARQSFPARSFADFAEIDLQQSQLYQKMGRYQEALKKLQSHMEAYKKIVEDRKEQDYQAKVVAMGLDDLEAENRRLRAAAEDKDELVAAHKDLKAWLLGSLGLCLVLIVYQINRFVRGKAETKADFDVDDPIN